MALPKIGITCSPRRGLDYYAPYIHALEVAGADPVTLEPESFMSEPRAVEVVGMLDGLLFPGGWDVEPGRYREKAESESADVDPPLDATEIALVRAALRSQTPVLGICRGQQVINVALGGTLRQHIDGHDMHGQPRHRLAHSVRIEPESEFSRATEAGELMVNSLHHQAVNDVAPGLKVTAVSGDGVVEGVESDDGTVVAVQCHPEELVGADGWAESLFRRFVHRAARNSVRARETPMA